VTVSTGSATFRDNARSEAGHELNEIQIGNDPDDWKPMKTVGPWVRQIRIREDSRAFRIHLRGDAPRRGAVLHACQKKMHAGPQRNIDHLAASLLRAWRQK
jgi:phage-related protein